MPDSASSPIAPVEQIQAFGVQLQSLMRRVEFLEAKTWTRGGSTLSVDALAKRAAEYAQEVFGCPARVECDCDPESPDYRWYNVYVTSDATHDELRKLRCRWYEQIAALELSDPTLLRLLVARPA